MSLNWSWKEKVGTITCVNHKGEEYEVSLYDGNAYLIEIYEFIEDGKELYTMHGFFLDKTHAKRCLGLTKDCTENLYKDLWKKVRLNKNYPHLKEFTRMLVQAFNNITIEVYNEEKEGEGE